MKQLFILLVFFLAISFFSYQPLLEPGFFPMHDSTQIGRVIAMGRALREGQFPVRIVPDLGYGYGYPIYNFYGPLPYYLGGFLYYAGIPALEATKVMIGLGIIVAFITMFYLVRSEADTPTAILAGVLYLYAPYHGIQSYVRGAVGELWATAFLPLVVFGVLQALRQNLKPAFTVGGIGLAAVILSHTIFGYITTGMLIVFIGVYLFYSLKSNILRLSVKYLVILLLAGVMLSAFFWMPAMAEYRYTKVADMQWDKTDYSKHYVCPVQLWSSGWGYGGSSPGCVNDGMSFMVGKPQLILAAIALAGWIFMGLKNRQRPSLIVGSGLLLSVIPVFLMIKQSDAIWRIIPGSAYIQYPWRFLAYAVLGMSISAGSISLFIPSRLLRLLLVFLLASGTIFYSVRFFKPQYIYLTDAGTLESTGYLSYEVSKISDEYLPADFKVPQNYDEIANLPITVPGESDVSYVVNKATYAKIRLVLESDNRMRINKTDFPGWRYLIDGVRITPEIVDSVPFTEISAGSHTVELIFGNTPIRSVGNIISVITAVFLFLYFHYGKKTYG